MPFTVCPRLCCIELCDGRFISAGRLRWRETMVFVVVVSCLRLFPAVSDFTSWTRENDALMLR